MSYLAFDLLLVALPAALLLAGADPRRRRAVAGPVALLAAVALTWTFPWDAHLVRTGVWTYGPDRVLATVGGIPVEELLLVVLEVVLVAAWSTRLPARATASRTTPHRTTSRRAIRTTRLRGTAGWLAVGATGALLLAVGGHARYLGLLLTWAAVPLALQTAVAGDVLAAARRTRALTALPVALWLCAADRFALADGIWTITPASSTGLLVLGLPVEEAAFFLLTALLVTDGLLLATSPVALARAAALMRSVTGRAGIGSRAARQPVALCEREARRCRSATPSSTWWATPPWSGSTGSPRASRPRSSPRSSTSTPEARSRTASPCG